MRKLTTAPNPPRECWLVMEKGAAKRFLGMAGETLSSLLLKPYFQARIAYYLRREDFHPAPSVDVVLVHLHRREAPDLAPAQREALERFIRRMAPCLEGRGRGPMSRRQAAIALRRAGEAEIPPSATLSYVQWLCLFRSLACLPRGEVCR